MDDRRGKLKRRVLDGELTLVMGVSLFDPAFMEIVALAGYDAAVLDACQKLWSPERVREMLYAADACGLDVILRVSDLAQAASALNFGVAGLMFDQVQTVRQAEEIVRTCKYAPLGERGMSARSRAMGYGTLPAAERTVQQNEDVLLIVQIEDAQGMRDMERIMRVPGIDAISGGRNDLALSLGVPGQPRHPLVLEAEDKIRACARAAGLPILLVASSPEEARALVSGGDSFLSVGQDMDVVLRALAGARLGIRQACLSGKE